MEERRNKQGCGLQPVSLETLLGTTTAGTTQPQGTPQAPDPQVGRAASPLLPRAACSCSVPKVAPFQDICSHKW